LHYVLPSISVVLTAFGYHVVIPSLASYLHGDVSKLKKAIWIGSAVPLVGYILWQLATLGIVPASGPVSIDTAFQEGMSGAELLAMVSTNNWVIGLNDSFAFFAIITSFLGVSLSLFDFLVDGLKKNRASKLVNKIFLLALLPPLVFAISYKRAFLSALEFAGAYGVVVLLALIPALMVWRKRYVLNLPDLENTMEIAPGGKSSLIAFIAISVCFILLETLIKLGVLHG
jgi:tyrosine-specific transport protein